MRAATWFCRAVHYFAWISVSILGGKLANELSAQQPPSQAVALATNEETTATRLRDTVLYLSETIGERNLSRPKKLAEAATYVEKRFEKMAFAIERQKFDVGGIECVNLIAELPGKTNPNEIILIGAHYDSAPGTPGANDNGSGTAALLEIARQLQGKPIARTIRFVAFANEEPPYFQRRGAMGSLVYAQACRQRNDDLKAVISLETMGFYTDEPMSQKYPPLLAALYPSVGNFVGCVSNIESRDLLIQTAKSLKKHCEVDVQYSALPAELEGVGWSDHWSFWQYDYPAIMVTDTAFFSLRALPSAN